MHPIYALLLFLVIGSGSLLGTILPFLLDSQYRLKHPLLKIVQAVIAWIAGYCTIVWVMSFGAWAFTDNTFTFPGLLTAIVLSGCVSFLVAGLHRRRQSNAKPRP